MDLILFYWIVHTSLLFANFIFTVDCEGQELIETELFHLEIYNIIKLQIYNNKMQEHYFIWN